jgi:hypothetical protein
MLLKIDVTQEDIDNGTTDPAFCPVALATTRALQAVGFGRYCRAEWEPYRAFVEPEGFTVWDDLAAWDGPLCRVPVGGVPARAYDFASDFDDWYDQSEEEKASAGPEFPRPGPFSFELELPLQAPRVEG